MVKIPDYILLRVDENFKYVCKRLGISASLGLTKWGQRVFEVFKCYVFCYEFTG